MDELYTATLLDDVPELNPDIEIDPSVYELPF